MKTKFQQATIDQSGAEPQARLTLVCRFESTLLADDFYTHFQLLEDLSDAQKAGHKVIITSHIIENATSMLPYYVEEALLQGFQVLPSNEFTLTGTQDLAKNPVHVDYAFDNKSIAGQDIYDDETDKKLPPYAYPVYQMSIDEDGNLSPFSREQFRAALGLETRKNIRVIAPEASRTLQ